MKGFYRASPEGFHHKIKAAKLTEEALSWESRNTEGSREENQGSGTLNTYIPLTQYFNTLFMCSYRLMSFETKSTKMVDHTN